MSRIALLGPQRLQPFVGEVARELEPHGSGAAITAGWQEHEDAVVELHEHLDRHTYNLDLYKRTEEVLRHDSSFADAYRERQNELRELQAYYRLRLDAAIEGVTALERRAERGPRWEEAHTDAMRALRTLDLEHATRIVEGNARFEEHHRPLEHGHIRKHHRQLRKMIDDAAFVAIAGGHVAVLLNRMRLFGLAELLAGKTIIAWSAGAMAISETIVLFHDNPPQGAGNAEILENGLGLARGVLLLPHAKRRLDLASQERIARLTTRFSPLRCIPMDEGDRIDLENGVILTNRPHRELTTAGAVETAGV
ncbi:MAG: type 1 glutamine amidotransferase-like domain-containing protein [Gemmatimonadetes bacterium]|nr:type 1 glutamine amidotransferase-like domain-containing protein [Gemmatimonadota bacterium]